MMCLATPVYAGSRLGAGQDPLMPHSIPAKLSISVCPYVSQMRKQIQRDEVL